MGDPLRILSANLKNGGADPEVFAALIESVRADVVACQELSPAQAEAISGLLPCGRLEPDLHHRGMGIALRRPAEISVVPLPYRNAWTASLKPDHWPGLTEEIEVVNVHISAPTQHPVWVQPARRFRQIGALVRYLGPPGERRRVIVGDFNSTPSWPAYWRMAKHFEDLPAAHARSQGRRPARTWRRWDVGPRLLRIDHCFARGLVAGDVQVLEVPGSDHCAVVADVSLP